PDLRRPRQAIHPVVTGCAGSGAGELARLAHRRAARRLPGAAQAHLRRPLLPALLLGVGGLPRSPADLGAHMMHAEEAGAFSPKESYDVCIIGSGAGGAVTAAILANAGFNVIVLEEGGHHEKAEFKMREDIAMPMLYQEQGARATKDAAISILQ